MPGVVARTCNPSYFEIGRIAVGGQSENLFQRLPISKITGVAQAVPHLLCKREALSSNPNPPPTHTTYICMHVCMCVSTYSALSPHCL
jgi:hypothetical protein